MNYLSDRITQMAESETLAMTQLARELKAQGKDVISLSIGEPDFNTPDTIKDAAKKAIDEFSPDFLFSINFFPLISDICNIYHIRYISWIVDCPVMELFYKQISNEWNRVFLFDRAQYDEVKAFNPKHIFHFPLAAGTGRKLKLFEKSSKETMKKFSHDIAFVGSLYTEKSPYDAVKNLASYDEGYLNGIMKAQEGLYGAWIVDSLLDDRIISEFKSHHPSFYELDSESYLTDRITLAELYIGNKISAMERLDTFRALSEKFTVNLYTMSDSSSLPKVRNMGKANSITEMPLIFRNSKINLNISSKVIRTGLPQRIFDIMSSGGFVLSNYQAEIGELFEIGSEIAVYESIDDLIDKCEYYLAHESERKEIAEAGFNALLSRYSYNIRIPQMIIKAFEI